MSSNICGCSGADGKMDATRFRGDPIIGIATRSAFFTAAGVVLQWIPPAKRASWLLPPRGREPAPPTAGGGRRGPAFVALCAATGPCGVEWASKTAALQFTKQKGRARHTTAVSGRGLSQGTADRPATPAASTS